MSGLHEAAREGFAAGAETYAAGRPDYPHEIEGWLRETLKLGAGRLAVDLGAGTGKFTARLCESGAEVIAVEPVAQMRARLQHDLAGVEAREGTATALPLASASVDALVCAQAFHWFASREALKEIARVLKPGGRLGLVWNERDERTPWVAELTQLIAPYEGDTPRFASGRWRDAFPAPEFGPLAEQTFAHAHVGPAERVVVDRLLSVSFIAALGPGSRADIAQAARDVLARHGLSGEVAFPYVTRAYSCERVSPAESPPPAATA